LVNNRLPVFVSRGYACTNWSYRNGKRRYETFRLSRIFWANSEYFLSVRLTFVNIPKVPSRLKEWSYAGFGFDFIFAAASIIAVDGLVGIAILPFVAMAFLVASYITYHKLQNNQ
jgi:hypothetical protein